MDEMQVTLDQQILAQMSEHHLMPFQGFGAMSDRAMGLQILLDRSLDRQALIFLS
jgi:hypothetical protein